MQQNRKQHIIKPFFIFPLSFSFFFLQAGNKIPRSKNKKERGLLPLHLEGLSQPKQLGTPSHGSLRCASAMASSQKAI